MINAVLVAVMITVWAGSIGMLWRINRVYRLRMQILDNVSDAARHDIRNTTNILALGPELFTWRYRVLDSVSFEKMVYTFWKPISAEAFYDDLTFMEPMIDSNKAGSNG